MTTIGDRLKLQRKARGWTLSTLGRMTQIDPSLLCRLETGRRTTLQLDAATRLAVALGVSLDYLAGLRTRPTDPERLYGWPERGREG